MRKYKIKARHLTQEIGSRTRDIKKIIKPLDIDEETGEILNLTKHDKLIETGEKEDLQDMVNSYKDEVDVVKILKRVAETGDTSILTKHMGIYEDISNEPTNYHEAVKMHSNAKDIIELAKEISENGNTNPNNGDNNTNSNNTNSNNDTTNTPQNNKD